jgi:hypothetical protein
MGAAKLFWKMGPLIEAKLVYKYSNSIETLLFLSQLFY